MASVARLPADPFEIMVQLSSDAFACHPFTVFIKVDDALTEIENINRLEAGGL